MVPRLATHSLFRNYGLVSNCIECVDVLLRTNLLEDPADSDTLDNSIGFPDLLHGPLAPILVDNVSDTNLGGRFLTGRAAGIPAP